MHRDSIISVRFSTACACVRARSINLRKALNSPSLYSSLCLEHVTVYLALSPLVCTFSARKPAESICLAATRTGATSSREFSTAAESPPSRGWCGGGSPYLFWRCLWGWVVFPVAAVGGECLWVCAEFVS